MKTTLLTITLACIAFFQLQSQTNKELYLDGHEAIALTEPILLAGDFTIEFWANLDSAVDEKDRVFGGPAHEAHFPGGKLALSENGANLIESPNAVIYGQWHHYAIRRNSTGLQIFVDGAIVQSNSSSLTTPLEVNLIGKKALKHGGFKGVLDEVRFWRLARSQGEIAADYNVNVTPATKDFNLLDAYFKFNEADGFLARDYTGTQPDVLLPDTLNRCPSTSMGLFTDNVAVVPDAFDRTIDAMSSLEVSLAMTSGVNDPNGILDEKDVVILTQPSYGDLLTDRSDSVFIHLQFASPPTDFTAVLAPLKYNKQVAYSFTLDDGLESVFTNVFPYLNGGIDASGQMHPGKCYTDGCGNQVSFTADIAWNSVNVLYHDLHINTPSYITWSQLVTMHQAGWCVMNHSYAHGSLKGDLGASGSIQKNQNHVHTLSSALGAPIWMKHQVLPAGDRDFITPGFDRGMLSTHNENGTDFVGGQYGWRVDGAPYLNRLKLKRRYKNNSYTSQTIHADLDSIMTLAQTGNRYWYNDFTHGVEPGGSAGGMDFVILKDYMDHLEMMYGKSGDDNLWVASSQEVYEYLFAKKYSKMTYRQDGQDVYIALDMNDLPRDFRWYDLSLQVDCSLDFTVVSVSGTQSHTWQGAGVSKLINVTLDHTQTDIITRYRKTRTTQPTDLFTYAVKDKDGNISPPATITITGLGNLPLPVEFLHFSGDALAEGNRLEWAFSTDVPVKNLALQTRLPAQDWTLLKNLGAQRREGHFLDEKGVPGPQDYRIEATDIDGHTTWSNVVTLFGKKSSPKVWSTLTDEKIFITLGEAVPTEYTILLMDINGQKVFEYTAILQPGNISATDVDYLSSGTYAYKLTWKAADKKVMLHTGKLRLN